MTRPLNANALITADDWGMSPGVNDGILELAKKGIVRRVSCMANGKHVLHRIEELKSLTNVEVGLHFDLTFEKSAKERRQLLSNKKLVLETFRSQWSKLSALGLRPSYLDGHHHIHLFPGVLKTILPEAKFAGVKQIRTVCDWKLLFSMKFPVVILSYLNRSKILAAGFSTLTCWYPNLERIGLIRFKNKLGSLKAPTEIIVHPANKNDLAELEVKDSYTDGRLDEFAILSQLISNPA